MNSYSVVYANVNDVDYIENYYDPNLEGKEYVLNNNARNFEPNIVHYNLQNNTIEHMYLNNSFNTIEQTIDTHITYTQNLIDEGDPTPNGYLTNNLSLINTPDNRIGMTSNGGTAFLMGPNIAVTAGHCVLNSKTKIFSRNLTIKFGYNGLTYFREVEVTDVYILKLYYDELSYANDWAVCIIDERLGDTVGTFGKCSGYNLLGYNATIIGYPGGQPTRGQYSASGEIVKNHPTIKYYLYGVGGFSGSPVFVTINGIDYVAGIHSYIVGENNHPFSGAARMTDFLFDFLNYFLLENNRGVEMRDYYYDGVTKIRYNTMAELIISPKENLDVYLSTNGSVFLQVPEVTKFFYTSTTTSANVSTTYNYFKNFDTNRNIYSEIYQFNTYFTLQARTAQYSIVNKTDNGDIIDMVFDQEDNIWYHYGSTNQIIKGTIAYNGYARNIEVTIPKSGTTLSGEVMINGITFQLRTGKNRVSIKASQNLVSSTDIIFAFGVE
jgi:V8-like Glu-specific endopeptidase